MVTGSAEKSDLKLLIDKFNAYVDQDRTSIVDLEHLLRHNSHPKTIRDLASACMNDRSLEKLKKRKEILLLFIFFYVTSSY